MTSKPKIFVLYTRSGVGYWRTWLPLETARKAGLLEVRYLDVRLMSPETMKANVKWCDIIHIQGLIGTDALMHLRQYQSLGRAVVTDYDDNHFNVDPFNKAYKEFGMEDVQVRNPETGDVQYLWKDGEHGFNIKANQVKFHSYRTILQEADAITTTTLYLKNSLAEISGREDNIHVLPNAIDFTQWKPLNISVREKLPGKFRFGWAVSHAHKGDFLMMRDTLKTFLARHSDAIFVVIGDVGMELKTVIPEAQLEWHPFSDLWEGHYPMRMAMLGLDCGIAPLVDNEFNKCKSPLKFEEYTAFGWPTIAQNMEPYSSHIVQGDTGLLAGTPDEWSGALETMYNNAELRAKLAFNARLAVKEMFDLDVIAREWAAVYANLITGHKNEPIELIK